eukprot:gene5119-918_t
MSASPSRPRSDLGLTPREGPSPGTSFDAPDTSRGRKSSLKPTDGSPRLPRKASHMPDSGPRPGAAQGPPPRVSRQPSNLPGATAAGAAAKGGGKVGFAAAPAGSPLARLQKVTSFKVSSAPVPFAFTPLPAGVPDDDGSLEHYYQAPLLLPAARSRPGLEVPLTLAEMRACRNALLRTSPVRTVTALKDLLQGLTLTSRACEPGWEELLASVFRNRPPGWHLDYCHLLAIAHNEKRHQQANSGLQLSLHNAFAALGGNLDESGAVQRGAVEQILRDFGLRMDWGKRRWRKTSTYHALCSDTGATKRGNLQARKAKRAPKCPQEFASLITGGLLLADLGKSLNALGLPQDILDEAIATLTPTSDGVVPKRDLARLMEDLFKLLESQGDGDAAVNDGLLRLKEFASFKDGDDVPGIEVDMGASSMSLSPKPAPPAGSSSSPAGPKTKQAQKVSAHNKRMQALQSLHKMTSKRNSMKANPLLKKKEQERRLETQRVKEIGFILEDIQPEFTSKVSAHEKHVSADYHHSFHASLLQDCLESIRMPGRTVPNVKSPYEIVASQRAMGIDPQSLVLPSGKTQFTHSSRPSMHHGRDILSPKPQSAPWVASPEMPLSIRSRPGTTALPERPTGSHEPQPQWSLLGNTSSELPSATAEQAPVSLTPVPEDPVLQLPVLAATWPSSSAPQLSPLPRSPHDQTLDRQNHLGSNRFESRVHFDSPGSPGSPPVNYEAFDRTLMAMSCGATGLMEPSSHLRGAISAPQDGLGSSSMAANHNPLLTNPFRRASATPVRGMPGYQKSSAGASSATLPSKSNPSANSQSFRTFRRAQSGHFARNAQQGSPAHDPVIFSLAHSCTFPEMEESKSRKWQMVGNSSKHRLGILRQNSPQKWAPPPSWVVTTEPMPHVVKQLLQT